MKNVDPGKESIPLVIGVFSGSLFHCVIFCNKVGYGAAYMYE